MLKNYLTIALRNLRSHKVYAAINIFGLTIGLTCCFLIFSYAQYEFSFNTQLPHGDRVYKIIRETTLQSGGAQFCERTSGPLGNAIRDQYPEIEEAVTLVRGTAQVQKENELSQPMTVAETNTNVLSFFNLTLLQGHIQKGVPFARTALLTQTAAQKIFGSENPIGQTIRINKLGMGDQYEVVGILKNLPATSTLQFDVLSYFDPPNDNWHWNTWIKIGWLPVETYIRVTPESIVPDLEKKLQNIFTQHMNEIAHTNKYHLQSYRNIYLHSAPDYNITKPDFGANNMVYGNIQNIYTFITIAAIILLIACANFVNLTTARALTRASEVGIRKTVGAHRGLLITQFLGESILFSTFAVVLAVILTHLLLPTFGAFFTRPLTFITSIYHIPALFLTALIIGILSGIYPAMHLSQFDPIQALKDNITPQHKSPFRKALITCQFAISIALIATTLIISDQLHYMQNKDLGFDKEQVLVLPLFIAARDNNIYGYDGYRLKQKYNTVKQTFLQHPNITAASVSRFALGGWSSSGQFETENSGKKTFSLFPVDEDFITLFDIPLLQGTNFSPSHAALSFHQRDSLNRPEQFIINQAAIKQLGLKDPIGKPLRWHSGRSHGTIIGVVKNFHFQTLKNTLHPVVLITQQERLKLLYLKILPQNFDQTFTFIQEKWAQFIPNRPLEFRFLDQDIQARYTSETRLQKALTTCTVLAIFLSSLGLFGLALLMMVQRTKEIGIRKVLGASIPNILSLLVKEHLHFLIIANLIAWPIAYYATQLYLQNYAYHITVYPTHFLIASLATLGITFAAIIYQALCISRTNPVDTLRSE